MLKRMVAILVLAVALNPMRAAAGGAWMEGWNFRRELEVNWEAEKATGDELATAQFYTAGHCAADGQDIRVATEAGQWVPSHVLLMGAGADVGSGNIDQASIVFSLQKGVRKYNVFFGNATQPDHLAPAPPKGMEDVLYKWGVLLETRSYDGQKVDNPQQLQEAFEHSKKAVGKALVDRMFLGISPFDDRPNTLMRLSGSAFAPGEGMYEFAGAVQNRGALFVDGKSVLWVPGLVGDVRFNAKVELKRGRHELVLLAVNFDGEPRLSVGWKRPDSDKVEVINKEAFGALGRASAGPLEERGKPLTADFSQEYLGECFFENHYSHRYKFEAPLPPPLAKAVKVEWDFGDGQRAINLPGSAMGVEHVYLSDGEYALKVSYLNAAGNDTQTTHLLVRRNRASLAHPPTDDALRQSGIVARYERDKLSGSALAWATMLHREAKAWNAMLATAGDLARHHDADVHLMMQALSGASDSAQQNGLAAQMVKVWDAVPKNSKAQPHAAVREAPLLLYRIGDFAKAVALLEPYAHQRDPHDATARNLLRLYGQALVLSGKPDDGKHVLAGLPIEQPERQPAMTGAMARTVEYFITEKDWQSGEEAWEKWQNKFPDEFAEGYSVLLQSKLMELAKYPEAAGKLAEAFALAVPHSSYAPQLLDRASRLQGLSDPEKGRALRALLKEKYPEDPLSQDGGE